MQVCPAASVTPVITMVLPAMLTVPQVEVTYPAELELVEGPVHPVGTASFNVPPLSPPEAAK